MELTIITTMGGKEFPLRGLSLKEMLQVKAWTGYDSKDEFVQAFNSEDVLAIQAAYALAVWRETGEKPTLSDLDFDLDTLTSRMVDQTGETVMLKFEQNSDGTLKLGEDHKPIVKLNGDGNPQFFYADTGDPVPTSGEEPTTSSPSPRSSGKSSASRSATPK